MKLLYLLSFATTAIGMRNLQKRTQKKSIIQNACLLKNKIDEINEEIRIFYVALTRAKNNLFLVGSYNFDKLRKKQFNKVYDCKSFWEMFLFANKGDNLNFFKNKKEKFTLNDGKESSADVEILQLEVNKEETIKKQPICLVEVVNDEVE